MSGAPVDLDDISAGVRAPAPREPVDLDSLVAEPGYAPFDWQAGRPDHTYGKRKPAAKDSDDLRRILALARRAPPAGDRAEAMIELIVRRHALPEGVPCQCEALGRPCITRPRLAQAWALWELATRGGLLGFVQVGGGKTWIDIMAAMAVRDCRIAVLLVPPSLVKQLILDYRSLAGHWRVPSMIVHGAGRAARYRAIQEGAPALHVLPYSLLSRPTHSGWLRKLAPDLIIADECHKLRDVFGAGAGRVKAYLEEAPTCRFAGWSGSLIDSSIADVAHIAGWALRSESPFPLVLETVQEWGLVLDPSPVPAAPGPLLELCEPGEHVRSGFRRRLQETSGVVSSSGTLVNFALEVSARAVPDIPEVIQNALKRLRDEGILETEAGPRDVVDPFEVYRIGLQLSQGYYYRWKFIHGETEEQIRLWLMLRKLWYAELREVLRPHLRYENFDSELLCTNAARRAWGDLPEDGKLPVWKAVSWPDWRDVKDTVRPITEPVRLHDFLVRDAIDWAEERPGIIWYHGTKEFGAWCSELSGLPLHAGGPKADERIRAERGERSIIASIKSHGTGRDGLQEYFARQLVASPPSSANEWEQLLGRLHRTRRDDRRVPDVTAEYYAHTKELRRCMVEAMRRSHFVDQIALYERSKTVSGARDEDLDTFAREIGKQELSDG